MVPQGVLPFSTNTKLNQQNEQYCYTAIEHGTPYCPSAPALSESAHCIALLHCYSAWQPTTSTTPCRTQVSMFPELAGVDQILKSVAIFHAACYCVVTLYACQVPLLDVSCLYILCCCFRIHLLQNVHSEVCVPRLICLHCCCHSWHRLSLMLCNTSL